jgi:lambda family phage portal protein
MLATVGRTYPAPRSARSATVLRVRNQAYEGAGTGRRTRGWRAPTVGPNDGILGSLSLLRDRSRAADRNDGFAWAIIRALVTNLIGCGITPQSSAPDPEFRSRLHTLWLRWTDFSDADGTLEFYGQQAQAARCWFSGGETFLRLRDRLPGDGLPVPLQVQIIEPEFCPHTYNAVNGQNKIRAGIEFSPIGQRVAYWMYRQRPGHLQDLDTTQLVRVPAETVCHLYVPERPGQIRGIPRLTRALVKLLDLDRFDDATLLRQQITNLFAGFVTRPAGTGDAELDPITGQPIETIGDRAAVGLEPGAFEELAPGEEVTFSDPPAVGDTYEGFMRQQLMGAGIAAGVPYEVFTGDLRQVNDRTVRLILGEFRRHVQEMQQAFAYQLCRPIWAAWFARAVLSGSLAVPAAYYDDVAAWQSVKWQPHGWPYMNPVQDVEADKAAIRSGLASRSSVMGARGENAEVVDQENAADNARADSLGLTYDSDARNGTAPSKRTTEPPDREDGDGTESQQRSA